jgi:hypothetical protein
MFVIENPVSRFETVFFDEKMFSAVLTILGTQTYNQLFFQKLKKHNIRQVKNTKPIA